jgi:hypothetical protein
MNERSESKRSDGAPDFQADLDALRLGPGTRRFVARALHDAYALGAEQMRERAAQVARWSGTASDEHALCIRIAALVSALPIRRETKEEGS